MGTMSRKEEVIDRRPGTVPEIKVDGDSVSFELRVAGAAKIGARLVIRCDGNGDAWVSIVRRPAEPSDF